MATPKVRVRHTDVPMWFQSVVITKDTLYGHHTERLPVFTKPSKPHTGGFWICFCGKKRNTLRSVQKHIKRDH